jgi:glycosyltransferase involved in cell wall biosynthesis
MVSTEPRAGHIGIFHPGDPVGPIPGGIDTVVRGVLKHAPPDLEYTLIGATSDARARPVGREIPVRIGDRAARFLPLVAADPSAARGVVPLSVRYMWALRRSLRTGRLRHIDILDFHRVEPLAVFTNDPRPKNVMMHQDMAVIRNKQCDIGWRHAPWLYERLERSLLADAAHVFCVRQSAVDRYQALFPALAPRFSFLPTWVDIDLFHSATDPGARQRTFEQLRIPHNAHLLISVGRLDRQKDPLLMLEAFAIAALTRPEIHLLIIGDGNLRSDVEQRVRVLGLQDKITMPGARQPREVSELLRASDLFVLSSAYEGMPIVVLEALASGVPVVTTDVGEVSRVVRNGINGAVIADRTPPALAGAICDTLTMIDRYRGGPCEQAVSSYHPERVLSQIYDNHRRQVAARAA